MSKTIVLIVLAILILSTFAYLILRPKGSTPFPTLPPVQQMSPRPTTPSIIPPTSIPTPQASPATENLVLTKVSPPEDPNGTKNYSPNARITFTFNKSLSLDTLEVMTDPKIRLNADYITNPPELALEPGGIEFWKPDIVYTVTIKKGLKATDGSVLQNDITYRIQAKLQGGE